MPYVYFTEEQKERANSIDLVDFLQRQGEKMLPQTLQWEETNV